MVFCNFVGFLSSVSEVSALVGYDATWYPRRTETIAVHSENCMTFVHTLCEMDNVLMLKQVVNLITTLI